MAKRVVGDAALGEIEFRYDDDNDPYWIVAHGATLRLERLADHQFFLEISTPTHTARILIGAKRAAVSARVKMVDTDGFARPRAGGKPPVH